MFFVSKNSIIFSKRAPIGAVAINTNELCTNQGCLSCVNKDVENIDVKYFYYVMAVATEQYELLGTWDKVAKHFGLTRKIIQGIRKKDS